VTIVYKLLFCKAKNFNCFGAEHQRQQALGYL